jgi:hypothetical protein
MTWFRILGLQNYILDYIKTKLLIWYGHIQRMADKKWPTKCWSGYHQEEERLKVRWLKRI